MYPANRRLRKLRRLTRAAKGSKFQATKAVLLIFFITVLLLTAIWKIQEISLDLQFGQLSDRLYALQTHKSTVLAQENTNQSHQIIDLSAQLDELLRNPVTMRQRLFLEREMLPRSRKYGLPDNLVAAQWALESARAVYRRDNNYWGIGPGWDFASLDKGMEVYHRTLTNILKRKGVVLSQTHDAELILRKLQEGNYRYEGHEPDPTTYIRSIMSTPEWRRYAPND